MKRIFTLTVLGLVFLLMGATPVEKDVTLTSFRVRNSDGDVIVRWKTAREQGLNVYILKRETPYTNNRFKEVARIAPHGASKVYRYRDREVYKASSEKIKYRLLALTYDTHTPRVLNTETVNYKPTAVRRTWGSIKAMFQ